MSNKIIQFGLVQLAVNNSNYPLAIETVQTGIKTTNKIAIFRPSQTNPTEYIEITRDVDINYSNLPDHMKPRSAHGYKLPKFWGTTNDRRISYSIGTACYSSDLMMKELTEEILGKFKQ